jgi:RimJ/RimL family protein N-acetyltransferase
MTLRIETERLVLRDFAAEDEADVHAYRSDPEVARYMLSHQPESREQTRAWLDRIIQESQQQPRRGHTLAIVERATQQVIGQISIGPGEDYPAPGELGVGYMLARPGWGQGYASEAAQAIVAFGFAALAARQISAWCFAENAASTRVLEKAGLHMELREESVWPKTGDRVVSFRYTIMRDEWRAQQDRSGIFTATDG